MTASPPPARARPSTSSATCATSSCRLCRPAPRRLRPRRPTPATTNADPDAHGARRPVRPRTSRHARTTPPPSVDRRRHRRYSASPAARPARCRCHDRTCNPRCACPPGATPSWCCWSSPCSSWWPPRPRSRPPATATSRPAWPPTPRCRSSSASSTHLVIRRVAPYADPLLLPDRRAAQRPGAGDDPPPRPRRAHRGQAVRQPRAERRRPEPGRLDRARRRCCSSP